MSGELCDAGVRNKHGHPDITRKDKKKNIFWSCLLGQLPKCHIALCSSGFLITYFTCSVDYLSLWKKRVPGMYPLG